MGVVMGVIIGISVGKADGDKVGYLLGRKSGTPCIRTVFIMCLSFLLVQRTYQMGYTLKLQIFVEATVLLCEMVLTVFFGCQNLIGHI